MKFVATSQPSTHGKFFYLFVSERKLIPDFLYLTGDGAQVLIN